MKKRLLKLFAVLLCAASLCAVATVVAQNGLESSSAGWGEAAVKAEYAYGETVTMPKRTFNGAVKNVTAAVIKPDGQKTSAENVLLDAAGVYGVQYTAVSNGRLYRDTVSFTVNYPVAYAGSRSEIRYGASDKATDTPGLVVSLAEGETLQFTQIIDLNGAKKNDCFVDLFVAPAMQGAADCEQFWITLTDVADEESFIILRANIYVESSHDATNFLVKGDGQPNMVGYEAGHGYLHKDNQYGAYHYFSMYGNSEGVYDRNGEINSLRISYEDETKSVYLINKHNGYTLIADLDDSFYVGDSLWKGFASGKVRMSFYAKNYMGERANFVFKSVRGADLTVKGIADVTAPEIKLGDCPDAVVGGRYKVPVPVVTDDMSGVKSIDVKVMRGALELPITDGRFATEAAGEYTVVYTASDYFGNSSQKKIIVGCKSAAPQIALNVGSMNGEVKRGEKIKLPEATADGGTGEITLKTYIAFGGQEVLSDGNYFVPEEAGAYQIKYVAEDEIGVTAESTVDFTAVNGDSPVFRDEPELPDYFLSGFSYRAPTMFAYGYAGGTETRTEAKLTVKDSYSEREIKTGGSFIPAVKENLEEVTLVWKAGDSELKRKVKTVHAIGGNGILTENYFIKDGVKTNAENDFMLITAEKENGSWTFVNDFIAEGFTLDISAVAGKSEFGAITVTLADEKDPSVSATLKIEPYGERSVVRVGGKYAILTSGFSYFSDTDNFKISFSDNTFKVGSALLAVKETDGGDVFTGFASGTVKLTVGFEGAAVGAQYRVNNAAGQTLGKLAGDRVRPNVAVLGDYGGSVGINRKVYVRRLLARDVLNPVLITGVSVFDPNDNPVVSEDGIVLNKVSADREYSFIADSFGQYRVEYFAEDSLSGRTQRIPYVVTVSDSVPPKVSVKTPMPDRLKKGDTLIIPDLEISDNITAAEDLIVNLYVVSATGEIIYLPSGSNSIKVKYAGTYQIRIIVTDGAGNITMLRHDVTVTE